MAIDEQSLYVQLGRLIEAMPNLKAAPVPFEVLQWIAQAAALTAAAGHKETSEELDRAANNLMGYKSDSDRRTQSERIAFVLYRELAEAEFQAPAAARGAFIPAGNAFDALTAIGKVLQSASREALIVDPYMNEKVLTDFAPLAREGVSLRLLTDEHKHKSTLGPHSRAWATQYPGRPMTVRLAPARTLHDRIIIADAADVWVLTQSFNAFASRSPASIVRVDPETAALKIDAYDMMWNSATPL
jgi:hypothetical protein